MAHIGLVVEGAGDQQAFPVLLRKHLNAISRDDVVLARPINTKGRGRLLKQGELERFVRLAATEPGAAGVAILCDSNSNPPDELRAELTTRCEQLGFAVPVSPCLAVREFENWIVASAETVAGVELPLEECEGRGAEATIRQWRAPAKYVKPLHQAGLAARIDLDRARARCPSLDRTLRDFESLLPDLQLPFVE